MKEKKVWKKKSGPSSRDLGKGGSEGKPLSKTFKLSATTYFLTYRGTTDSGQRLTKELLRDALLSNPRDRSIHPVKHLVAQQMYDSGQPHFHVILVYPRRKQILDPAYFDLLGIHPNVQTMRNLKAALAYLQKQDPHPLTDMDLAQEHRVARAKDTSSLYPLLREQMLKDPLNFDPYKYCRTHGLDLQIYKANYSKAVRLLKQMQRVQANARLSSMPGIRPISRELVVQRLSPAELKTYDSWPGYDTIARFLEVIQREGGRRQQKSMNLLISGPPSTGKSALVYQRAPLPGRSSLASHLPVYPMGMKDWFPEYQSDVYSAIYWNQARLTSYSMDVILQLLDGSPVMLPAKGGGHKKVDNPTVVMTSNKTLDELILQKYPYQYQADARALVRAQLVARITNVVIPFGYDLFLLQKLLIPKV